MMLFLDIPEPMDGKLRQKILRRQKWKRAVKWGIAAFVVVLLFINFKFFISPHTKDFFKSLGLDPEALNSPEVYGGAIQSLVTALTVVTTFYIYNRSKTAVMSQKVYDQKFEAYSRIWEKVQKIEQEFERTAVRPDYHDALANLKKEIEHFYQFCRSKYLVVSPTVMDLLGNWTASCYLEVTSKINMGRRHYGNVPLEQITEWHEYRKASKARKVSLEQLVIAMKMDLGLLVLEEEIDESFGKVSEEIKGTIDEIEKFYRKTGLIDPEETNLFELKNKVKEKNQRLLRQRLMDVLNPRKRAERGAGERMKE